MAPAAGPPSGAPVKDMLALEGKRVLLAGAGSVPGRAGHGRLTALRLAEAGARVACVDLD